MQCNFSMYNSWLKLFVPTTTGWTDSFTAEMKQMVASNTACFWPTLFLQCEFVADNLLGSPGQVTTPCCSPPLLDQLGQRALELELTLAPDENLCGTLGACTCFPRKDIQLRVWFVCWFGCFNWTLHRYPIQFVNWSVTDPGLAFISQTNSWMGKMMKNHQVWTLFSNKPMWGWSNVLNLISDLTANLDLRTTKEDLVTNRSVMEGI